MSSNKIIVAITEGERTEPQLIENMQNIFFRKNDRDLKIIPYKTHIYSLYKRLKDDNFDTDVIELLKELNQDSESIISSVKRDDVQEIFLFFDYDGHVPGASDFMIDEMIKNFDNETENGKIYISYPMVESIKDVKRKYLCYDNCCVKKEHFKSYKNTVSQRTEFCNLTALNGNDWKILNEFHLSKANCLLCNKFEIPDIKTINAKFSQLDIFTAQKNNFLYNKNVMVISGFPLFLVDYFGIVILN